MSKFYPLKIASRLIIMTIELNIKLPCVNIFFMHKKKSCPLYIIKLGFMWHVWNHIYTILNDLDSFKLLINIEY